VYHIQKHCVNISIKFGQGKLVHGNNTLTVFCKLIEGHYSGTIKGIITIFNIDMCIAVKELL
jgi:hypothetical protein